MINAHQAQAKPSGWVSVDKALPEGEEFTLVWCAYEACHEPHVAYLDDVGKWVSEASGLELECKVSHWMPIEPPR